MWGVDDLQNPEATKTLITDPEVIVAALVHCIDRASGRIPAVHDPDTEHRLRDQVARYRAQHMPGQLSSDARTEWMWKAGELKKRRIMREKFWQVEGVKRKVEDVVVLSDGDD